MGCVSVVLADAACFIGFPVADAFRGVVLKEAQWVLLPSLLEGAAVAELT